MARSLAVEGVTIVCGTPHVRDDYPTTPQVMESALGLVRAAVGEAAIAIEVRGGGEIALDRLPTLDPDARTRFGLGGNPQLLLLETPYAIWLLDLPRTCAQLRREGIVPVLAHPERNPYVKEDPTLLEDVVRSGAFVQLTAASVEGRLGRASCIVRAAAARARARPLHCERRARPRRGRGRHGRRCTSCGRGRARTLADGGCSGGAAGRSAICRRGPRCRGEGCLPVCAGRARVGVCGSQSSHDNGSMQPTPAAGAARP